MRISYNDISLEECFINYHTKDIEFICDGDKKEIDTIGDLKWVNIQN